MQHIETVTLSASQSSIEFTSILQDYDDLVVLLSARSDRASKSDGLKMELNGLSDGFNRVRLVGNGSSASSGSAADNFVGQTLTAATSTANTFGNASIYISNYSSSQNKSISVDCVSEDNAATAFQEFLALIWSNATAVSSINFVTTNAANFVSGSTASLYGITAGSDETTTVS